MFNLKFHDAIMSDIRSRSMYSGTITVGILLQSSIVTRIASLHPEFSSLVLSINKHISGSPIFDLSTVLVSVGSAI